MANEFRLDIKDTEFLLRHLLDSQYLGKEVEQAFKTLEKVKELHKNLMELYIEV